MEITIEVERCLSNEQQVQIRALLSPLVKGEGLKQFCEAAIADFADALFDRRADSATLTPQMRLYHLVKYALAGNIPDETTVSRLFGIPERKATSMIEIVAKRHRSEFEEGFSSAVSAAFKTSEPDPPNRPLRYRFRASQPVIEYLRELVKGLGGGRLAPIQRVRGTAERYEVASDTYKAICLALNITP